MLRYEITLKSGKIRGDLKPLAAAWKSELDVPADSLSLTLDYDRELFEQAQRIRAYYNDSLIFDGQLDELARLRQGSGLILKLSARSMAAALLDNEAEPLSYRNPTAVLMYEKHLKPFGLSKDEPDAVPVIGDMRIDKGMTHWQVLEMFCKSRYGSKLRISGGGQVYLRGYNSEKFIKFGMGGEKYIYIKEYKRPHKLITEVKLKVSNTTGYLSSIKNTNPECDGIKRMRYVNAISDNSSLNTADKIIERSNLDSYYIKLCLGGCAPDILGAKAEINDNSLGEIKGLIVRELSYSLSAQGELTTVVLGKENYNVAS